MTIQWFPGHMARARREVSEKLKLVDVVIELRDARAPESSENPMLQEVVKDKPKLIVLMKRDLADENMTAAWLTEFNKSSEAIAIDVNNSKHIDQLIKKVNMIGQKESEKLKAKGVNPRATRAMVIGIPNVGKSSLINRLANRKIAKIGDVPGVTRKQAWIKVKNEFDLLDTPGILWPKFENKDVAYRLAALGTIKDDLLPLQDVAAYVLNYLQESYPELLYKRYSVIEDLYDMWDIFEAIGKRFGAIESGGKVNFDKVAHRILQDLRTAAFGQITLEQP